MPKLKVLSGDDVISIFAEFGFTVVAQKGSHAKLRRTTQSGLKQTLTIPKHEEIDRGTLKAIYNQALRYIPEGDLQEYFFSQ